MKKTHKHFSTEKEAEDFVKGLRTNGFYGTVEIKEKEGKAGVDVIY